MKTLGERFRWRREQLGLTQEDAVKEINRLLQGDRKLARVTISNIENGSQESMKDKVLLAVIQVFKCSAEWLVNNRGPIEPSTQAFLPRTSTEEVRLVPLIDWSDAISAPNIPAESLAEKEMFACPIKCDPLTFALKITGETMLPRFEPGDIIFVNFNFKKENITNGSFVVALSPSEDEVTLKQYQLIDNKEFLKSTNPDHPSEMRFMKMEDGYKILGVVFYQIKPV
ncbi:transcriptional repressor DicA [Serratia fonticola]|uniref:S24 family peptidase n=1 Tax=Serratia fonticola TaxID=47917 RepID=UPI0021833A65|nr:S24 family peptidase [Serratia fonticola]CAI2145256.1 transcriptional repressor DicA [Serratia fonticola]